MNTSYYDLVLGLIPVSIITSAGLLSLTGVSFMVAIGAGCIPAVGIMGHAMFVRAPIDPVTSPEKARGTAKTAARNAARATEVATDAATGAAGTASNVATEAAETATGAAEAATGAAASTVAGPDATSMQTNQDLTSD